MVGPWMIGRFVSWIGSSVGWLSARLLGLSVGSWFVVWEFSWSVRWLISRLVGSSALKRDAGRRKQRKSRRERDRDKFRPKKCKRQTAVDVREQRVSKSSSFSFSLSFSSRWHRRARKGPYALHPVFQQSSQGCPRNSVNICLVEHRSFSTSEGGMSAASFLRSSFLQAINAVMSGLSVLRKFLKPRSTSVLSSSRPVY